ncbi:MAG: hypothetical protein QXL15_04725, partial [Candidatus Korarchaeota archaeon]
MGELKYRDIWPIHLLYFQHKNGIPILTYNLSFSEGPMSELVAGFSSAISSFLEHIGMKIRRITFRKVDREYSILFFEKNNIMMTALLAGIPEATINILIDLFDRVRNEVDVPEQWTRNDPLIERKIKNIIVDTLQLKKFANTIEETEMKVKNIIEKYHQKDAELMELIKRGIKETEDYVKKTKLQKELEDLRKEYELITGDSLIPPKYYKRRILEDLSELEKEIEIMEVSVSSIVEKESVLPSVKETKIEKSTSEITTEILADIEREPSEKAEKVDSLQSLSMHEKAPLQKTEMLHPLVKENLQKAEELFAMRRWQEAIKIYSSILEKTPLNTIPEALLVTMYARIGTAYSSLDNNEESINYLYKAVSMASEMKKKGFN